MIKVYHFRDDLAADQRREIMSGDLVNVATLWNAGGYEQVAEVASDELEVAWELTNTIDSSGWSLELEPRVTLKAPLPIINGHTYGRRSSMMGDVFVFNGVAQVVAMMGFEPLPDVIEWKQVRKQALIDALRNSAGNLGLSNLSRQNKSDLIEAAHRIIAAGSDYAAGFKAHLDREIAFQRGRK